VKATVIYVNNISIHSYTHDLVYNILLIILDRQLMPKINIGYKYIYNHYVIIG